MKHKEIRISVNAWIDEGVAPLVEALNLFPDVLTLESCECAVDGFASVTFDHRRGEKELVRMISKLSTELGTRIESCCEIRFRLEWLVSGEAPMAELLVQPALVQATAVALKDYARSGDRGTR